ncbi:hypothetical protein ACKKBF_B12545 [Auxenochlorella protothecoides x Auxenochlorella symbiontica]
MPSISNAGGSLTSALALTLLAWAVRWWREEASKSKAAAQSAKAGSPRVLSRFHSGISLAALKLLVETGACPHLIFDVRQDPSRPLPPELKGALCIPAGEVEEVLSHPKRWAETFGATRRPPPSGILVFLGSTAGEQEEGAAGARAAGYDRTLALAGTLAKIEEAEAQPPQDLSFLRADALGLLLMGEGARQAFPCPVTVIDVRRWEERLLFGSIRTSQALPVEELPSALNLSPGEFEELYRFPKPSQHDLVVVASRSHARAAWAATLAADAGYTQWLVLQSGHNGWRFDANVKPYHNYATGEAPPEPEDVATELPDRDEGLAELAALGLL